MARLLEQVCGQERAKEALLLAVEAGRLPHALLLAGPSGVGKRLLARGLAQALMCEKSRQACGVCRSCLRMTQLQHENYLEIEPQAGSIKIEPVRNMAKFLSLQSWRGARVVVVDQAHLLNPQAANAALKLLEEPPPETYFILVSSNIQALLPTIRSRCQILTVGPLKREIVARLRDLPAWIIDSCQGRLDLADQLGSADSETARQGALAVMTRLVQREKVHLADDWREIVQDRESGLFIAGVWAQLVRDARFAAAGAGQMIHGDWQSSASQLALRSSSTLDGLYAAVREYESDLQGNVERVLATECFLLKAQELLR